MKSIKYVAGAFILSTITAAAIVAVAAVGDFVYAYTVEESNLSYTSRMCFATFAHDAFGTSLPSMAHLEASRASGADVVYATLHYSVSGDDDAFGEEAALSGSCNVVKDGEVYTWCRKTAPLALSAQQRLDLLDCINDVWPDVEEGAMLSLEVGYLKDQPELGVHAELRYMTSSDGDTYTERFNAGSASAHVGVVVEE